MWNKMKMMCNEEFNTTYTENGAVTNVTSGSACLDLFAAIGALRAADEGEVIKRFSRAFAEDADTAMKILFFARDVRGGLGERRVFRVIMKWLAESSHSESALKNIPYVAEFGRFDDLMTLMGTKCGEAVTELIKAQIAEDRSALTDDTKTVSLLGKWLPSINASSKETRRCAMELSKALGMNAAEYRRMLSELRAAIGIIENNLREKDYTFDYAKQPSKAMYKYRCAFIRNDKERYSAFMEKVEKGEAVLHTGTLTPYDVIAPIVYDADMTEAEKRTADVTWKSLEDFTRGENALVVVDGSGSMYSTYGGDVQPAAVAMSLGVYFAERNKGVFRNRFITFSNKPRLIEIPEGDIYDKVRFCMGYNEVANTNIERVFKLILDTAVNNGIPQEELPSTVYMISDMEFDCCANNAGLSNFENAKKMFAEHGYKLPQLIFWNVSSRNEQQPVTQNEQGAALVSGCSPRIFSMLASGNLSPLGFMRDTIGVERYAKIKA